MLNNIPIIASMLTCLMITVMLTDITRFTIPNWIVAIILLLYPVMLYFSPVVVDWKMALVIMAGVFSAGFVLFVLHVMGGGDIKLLLLKCTLSPMHSKLFLM